MASPFTLFDVFNQLEDEAARADELRLRVIASNISARNQTAIGALDVMLQKRNVVVDDIVETQKNLGKLEFTAAELTQLGAGTLPTLPDTYKLVDITKGQLESQYGSLTQKNDQLTEAINVIGSEVTEGLDYLQQASAFESELTSIQKNLTSVLPFIYADFVKDSQGKSTYEDYIYDEAEFAKLVEHLQSKSSEVGYDQFKDLSTNETKNRVLRGGLIDLEERYTSGLKTGNEIASSKNIAEKSKFDLDLSKLNLKSAISLIEEGKTDKFREDIGVAVTYSKERSAGLKETLGVMLSSLAMKASSMSINVIDMDAAKDRLDSVEDLIETIPAQYRANVANQITNLMTAENKSEVASGISNLFLELGNASSLATQNGDDDSSLAIGQLGTQLLNIFQQAGVVMDSKTMLQISEYQSSAESLTAQILGEQEFLSEVTNVQHVLNVAQELAGVRKDKKGEWQYNEVKRSHVTMAISAIQEPGIRPEIDPIVAQKMLEDLEIKQKELSLDGEQIDTLVGLGTLYFDANNNRYINVLTGDILDSSGQWQTRILNPESLSNLLTVAGYEDPNEKPDKIDGKENIDYVMILGKAVPLVGEPDKLKMDLLAAGVGSYKFVETLNQYEELYFKAGNVQSKIDANELEIEEYRSKIVPIEKWMEDIERYAYGVYKTTLEKMKIGGWDMTVRTPTKYSKPFYGYEHLSQDEKSHYQKSVKDLKSLNRHIESLEKSIELHKKDTDYQALDVFKKTYNIE